MMRYLAVVLSSAILVAFLGCAGVEPPVQVPAPIVVAPMEEPSEPNEAGIPEAIPPADVAPEAGLDAEAVVPSAEVNEPPAQTAEAPDPNNAPPAEPNDAVPAPEIQESGPAPEAPSELRTSLYARYAEILAAYVREDGLVDYGGLRRRRLDLKPILTTLDELDPNVYRGWSQQEQLAFWINAYNLKMLDIIARNYPIESSWWLRLTWSPSDIRHIKGIWTDYRFIVMDEEFTLAEVEQRFFRKTFEDPRIWLALTYACQSSPPLRRRPYGEGGSEKAGSRSEEDIIDLIDPVVSEVNPVNEVLFTPRLDQQLDEQVKRFLASPQGLQIDRRNRVVRLSALFKPNWRGREFVGRYGTDRKFKAHDPETRAVLNFLTNYLSREDVEFLEVENYSLEYLNFDWRLNDTDRGY